MTRLKRIPFTSVLPERSLDPPDAPDSWGNEPASHRHRPARPVDPVLEAELRDMFASVPVVSEEDSPW